MAKAKSRTVKVNMKDVETSVLVPEGDFLVEVAEVTVGESESSGKEYLKWKFNILTPGPSKDLTLYHYTSLQPQALFNLKAVLMSLGVQVPASAMNIELDDMEGRQMGVTVTHEQQDGKTRAHISETFPWAGEESEEDDEVDPATLDIDELLEFATEHDITVPAKIKKNKAKVLALVEEAMAAEEEEEEEEEPEEKPVKKTTSKAATKTKKPAPEPEEEEEEDDESEEEVDLETMNLKQLKAFAVEQEIDIPAKIAKNAIKIREFIAANMPDDEEEVDLESMGLDELLAFAKEQGIAISKKIKTNEKKVRAMIAAELDDEEE